MKSFGGLWTAIIAPEALEAAMRRAARGKKHRGPVARFLANPSEELGTLRRELETGVWQPSPFVQFAVRDPKPRLISCAAFRDRVVHHALCDVIGPYLERSFIPDSFACRVGKGSHRAVFRAQVMTRRWGWFAKLDIRRYFDSIDHRILLNVLQPRFREAPVRRLIETIVRFPLPGQTPGKGLPIGNLTSQWFANAYLDGLDHHCLERLGVCGYVRYMDDILLFDECPHTLNEHVITVIDWVKEFRALEVKSERLMVGACRDGVPFLGWRVFPGCLRLQPERRRRSLRLFRKRQKDFVAGLLPAEKLTAGGRAITAGIRALRPTFRFDRWGMFALEG